MGESGLVLARVDRRASSTAAAGDHADLLQGGGVADGVGDDRVAGLVDGDPPQLVVAEDVALARRPGQHAVDRLLELGLLDQVLARAHGQQRRLVDDVGEVGPGEARRLVGEGHEIGVRRHRRLGGVQREDLGPPVHVGHVDDDLAVEASRAQQRAVEDVGSVRGRHHHDARLGAEAIHLDEHLVERLLTLVVALALAGTALAPDAVELVHEDDRRRHLAGLAEEVAHAGRAHADERLDELRAGEREEVGGGLAGHGPGEQRLAGAGGAGEQDALRGARAEARVAARVLQEVADLAQLDERLRSAGHVGEREVDVAGLLAAPGPLRERRERPALVAGERHEEREQRDQDEDRQQELDDDPQRRLPRSAGRPSC